MTGSLRGQTALVTGGGRGIGKAVVLALAREGATVAVAARTAAEIEAVAEECRSNGGDAIAIPLDVSQPAACESAVAALQSRLGRLDVLVNNAGIATSQKFVDVDDATWGRTLAVDLSGPFYLTRAALPDMLRQGSGTVIFVSSIAGRIGAPYIAPYAAAKHGVLGLMRSLASEHARSGITFNAVCPAYVDTPMTEGTIETIMLKTGRSRAEALCAVLTPQGRLITPEEVAAVCLLLASPGGRGINGQAINVDGGQVQS